MTDTQRLTLPGALTIYEALDLKAQMLQAMTGAQSLHLDASGVGEVDTAGVQLLLWLEREGLQRGCPVHLAQASDALRETLAFCRLESLLKGE